MNQQPPEKHTYDENGVLDVHSIFLTIQGEGPFTGRRAIFIRLAGCNLQCPMCDTEYTSGRSRMSPAEVLRTLYGILREKCLVVLTGGEPFRQNLRPLVATLLGAGYDIQIETNGTLYQDLPYSAITVVCSPKAGSVNKKLLPHIAALKYVLQHNDVQLDGLPSRALEHPNSGMLFRPPAGFGGIIYLQPADAQDQWKNSLNLGAAISSVLKHGYTLCLQTHKITGME